MALLKSPPAVFELKSGSLPVLVLHLKTPELPLLAESLASRMGAAQAVDATSTLDIEPVVVDLGALRGTDDTLDFPGLIDLLRSHRLAPLAVRGGSPAQSASAALAGLFEADDGGPANAPVVQESEDFPATVPTDGADRAAPDRGAAPAPAPAAPADAPAPTSSVRPTLLIDRPLRSGQQVYARGADLVITAVVNFGAEVIADGHIHVYAPLRGRAIAGARGNTDARIFTTCLEPELIAIAGTYRTSETALPTDVRGKPAQVRLVGDRLVMEPV
jgi:septum site-determining protein MinC